MRTLGLFVVGALQAGCAAQPAPLSFIPAPGSPYKVGPHPERPAIADLNADGRPDIALTCGSRVVILLGPGFAAAPLDLAGLRMDKIAVHDFNSDGKPDAAGVHHDSYDVHILLGDGRAGLAPAPGSPVAAHTGSSPHTHDVACADINADGHADILTTNADDNAISVLLGDGHARFTPAPGSPFPAAGHPYAGIAVRDVSGDGKPDVVAPLLHSHQIGVYLGDGTGAFTEAPGSPHRVRDRPGVAYVDDLDGDGRPDILATHDDVGMLDVLLSTGEGRFHAAQGSPLRLSRGAWSITTADFDADGHTDVLLGSQGRGRLTLLLNDDRAGLREARVDLPTGDEPNNVTAADLNADGKPDIVTTNYASGDVTVLLAR